MVIEVQVSEAERSGSSRHGAHARFSALVLAGVAALSGLLAWLGAQGASWAWPLIGLPIIYSVGALLYRWESALRLPGWMAQAIEISATIWPPIKWLAASDEVQTANEAFVNDFNLALAEYGLEPLSEAQGEQLARRARPLTVRTLAREWTQERLKRGDDDVPSVDVLELLSRERSGEITVNLWQARKADVVDEVATLVMCRHVSAADATHPASDVDARVLLGALRDFEVDVVVEELRALDRIGGRLQRYADFVAGDQAASGIGDVTALIGTHGGELPDGRSTLYRLEDPAETLRLMDAVERCDDPSLRAVHRGIFLAERDVDPGALKERACAALSRWNPADGGSDPVRILQAYLWEKYRRDAGEDRHGTEPITPGELDSAWRQWSDDARSALAGDFAADRNRLAERLDSGSWPTHRSAPGDANPYPAPQPTAMPEHEEVRQLDAYLITFDERAGSLAKVIDGLMPADRRSIYRFGPYTRNTRLGIVPRGMPFHEFVEHLFADLDDALRRYRPGLASPRSRDGVLRFIAGRPHTIELKHDHPCEGPVEFAITERPHRGDLRDEATTTDGTDPADGQLGAIERWVGRDARHALIRYYPGPVEEPHMVCFAYSSRCKDETESHTVSLLIEPKGQQRPLDRIEITVNRVDLEHCREIWFGDPVLGSALRAPSIHRVLQTISPDLEEAERAAVEAALTRVAGPPSRRC